MAEAKTQPKERSGAGTGDEASPPLMASIAALQKSALGPAYWFGASWLEAAGDINAEFARFLAARIREDVRTQHEILHCRDAARLRDIQVGFIERAIEQYTEETGKIVELSQTHLQRIVKPPEA